MVLEEIAWELVQVLKCGGLMGGLCSIHVPQKNEGPAVASISLSQVNARGLGSVSDNHTHNFIEVKGKYALSIL
jgi:hypothetical protein